MLVNHEAGLLTPWWREPALGEERLRGELTELHPHHLQAVDYEPLEIRRFAAQRHEHSCAFVEQRAVFDQERIGLSPGKADPSCSPALVPVVRLHAASLAETCAIVDLVPVEGQNARDAAPQAL
jgi:hypothetical protein